MSRGFTIVNGAFRPQAGKKLGDAQLDEARKKKAELERELEEINAEEKRIRRVFGTILSDEVSQRREKIRQLLRDEAGGKYLKSLRLQKSKGRQQNLVEENGRRLRKKLGLSSQQDLSETLLSLEGELGRPMKNSKRRRIEEQIRQIRNYIRRYQSQSAA